jgi:hypothetical protein
MKSIWLLILDTNSAWMLLLPQDLAILRKSSSESSVRLPKLRSRSSVVMIRRHVTRLGSGQLTQSMNKPGGDNGSTCGKKGYFTWHKNMHSLHYHNNTYSRSLLKNSIFPHSTPLILQFSKRETHAYIHYIYFEHIRAISTAICWRKVRRNRHATGQK